MSGRFIRNSLRKQKEFFKQNPASFKGEKKTFHAAEGQLEDPTNVTGGLDQLVDHGLSASA